MKVHLNQIPQDGLHVEGDEDHDILEINDELVQSAGPVHYVLDIGISEGGLFATGQLTVPLELECVRCLEKFTREIELENFAMHMDLSGPEMIDLTPAMREDILLALPTHPHCDWDGETICPGIRSSGKEKFTDDTSEEDAHGAPKAWDALDQLQIRPKN